MVLLPQPDNFATIQRRSSVMRIILYLACCLCLAGGRAAFAHEPSHPDCAGPAQWAASAVGVRLKDLQLSTKAADYDAVEVERLASEQISPDAEGRSLFRQVHKVTVRDGGNTFVAITVNVASRQECSESGVDVYVVSLACGADDRTCRRYGAALGQGGSGEASDPGRTP